jgi:hypothetical protein
MERQCATIDNKGGGEGVRERFVAIGRRKGGLESRAEHSTIATVLLTIFENKYTIPYCNSFREAQ